jgi:hypothetical protein
VYQGNLLITDRDRILPVDAMQMHLDEVQAAEDAKKEGKQAP